MNNQDIKRLEQQSEKDRNDALYWQEKYYEAMKTQDEKTLEAMAGIGADELMPCEICGHKGNPIFHTSSEPHKVWCASCGHKFYGDGHGDLKARWNTRDDIQLPAPYADLPEKIEELKALTPHWGLDHGGDFENGMDVMADQILNLLKQEV